jgi:very-short-patch-repair endonuclease
VSEFPRLARFFTHRSLTRGRNVDGLYEIAARQYSSFTAEQATRCGMSPDALFRAVRRKELLRLHTNVFAFAGSPETWERSMLAACLAAGPLAVASHRAAARIWNLVGPGDEIVEITVPYPLSPQLRRVVVHRSRDLVSDQTTVRNRIPVTNLLRTMVDLAAVLPPDKVEDALDAGLRWPSLFSIAAVEATLDQLGGCGRSGAGVLRKVLEERVLGGAVSDSDLEKRMARLLKKAKLPSAVFHYVVSTPAGLFLAEVDFAYPEIKLAIEVDGFDAHGTPRAMAKDFVRQNGLVPYKWHVLRFTWRQVTREPAMVAATIRRTLEALQAA